MRRGDFTYPAPIRPSTGVWLRIIFLVSLAAILAVAYAVDVTP